MRLLRLPKLWTKSPPMIRMLLLRAVEADDSPIPLSHVSSTN